MKLRNLLPVVVILALLTGCGSTAGETTQPPASDPAHATQATETATEPSTEPSTEPPTEPPLELDAGPRVYINGIQITDTARYEGTVYVSAAEFCQALGGETDQEGISRLVLKDVTYSFRAEHSHMTRDSKAVVLCTPVLNNQGNALIPLEELCEFARLSVYWDYEYDSVYCTAAAYPGIVPEGYDVPVFMYHAVSDDTWGIDELFVMPERMEQQLQYLTENGYDPIFFEDLYHLEEYDKPVILTFDDGYADNYTELFPLLQKYNVKATIFIITGYVNQPLYLTTEQILEMADSGLVSIQSHTVTHPNMDELSYEQQQKELADSKLQVTRLSRRESFVFCYPTGKYNSNTLELLPDYYAFGIKMRGGLYETHHDTYLVNRYYVAREDTIYWFRSVLEDIFD